LKILLDQNVPAPLTRFLLGHNVIHTSTIGWETFSNGDLLAAAETDGFELLITADKNIRYQQNLTVRTIALVVLSTNDWPSVRAQLDIIVEAVKAVTSGSYAEVTLDRPAVRRRSPPGGAVSS
jgi:predicted nuclease of predicted toxin-antitoxin system